VWHKWVFQKTDYIDWVFSLLLSFLSSATYSRSNMTPENDNTNSRDGGHEEVLHILIDVLIGTHHHEVTSQTELAEALQESNTEKVRIY
jgi:hypothetical protein